MTPPDTSVPALDSFMDASRAGHTAPRGFDRLVMRLSVTMMIWARNHADRIAVSHEDRSRSLCNERARVERTRNTMLLAYRQR